MPDTVAPASAPSQAAVTSEQSASTQPQGAHADPEFDFGDGLRMTRSAAAQQLKNLRELQKGSYSKFEEAAKLRKDTEALLARADDDPEGFYKARGKDFKKLAAERLMRDMQEQEMSPEQRENARIKLERDAFKAEKEAFEKQQLDQQEQQAVQAHTQHWDTSIAQALAASDLPRTPRTVARAADKLMALAEQGVPIDRLPMSAIIEEIRGEFRTDLQSVVKSMSATQLREYLGPEAIKALNQASIEAVRNPQKSQTKAPEQRASSERKKAPESMSVGSWREHLRTLK